MNRVPNIRFKEFSGEWEEKKIGRIMECLVPGRNKPQEFKGEIPWITTPDISNKNFVYHSKNKLYVSEIEIKRVGAKIVPKNSVIMSCVGELGIVCIAGIDIVINQQLHAFLPNENISSIFIKNALLRKIGYMETVATKTAVLYMNKESCNSIPIFFPPLPEQEKIADFLSSVDIKIEKLERKKELWEEYKKGMMQKIFSQEIRFKDENGKEYPQWDIKTVEKIAKIRMGFTPDTDNTEFWNGEYLWLSIADMKKNGKYISFTSKFISKDAVGNKKILPKGTLIMSFKLTLGRVGILEKEMFTNEAICNFEWLKNDVITEYIYYYLNSIKIESFGSQAAKGITLNTESLNSIVIKLPVFEEQEKIAHFLSSIDSKIEITEKELEGMKEFKKGLLRGMFV